MFFVRRDLRVHPWWRFIITIDCNSSVKPYSALPKMAIMSVIRYLRTTNQILKLLEWLLKKYFLHTELLPENARDVASPDQIEVQLANHFDLALPANLLDHGRHFTTLPTLETAPPQRFSTVNTSFADTAISTLDAKKESTSSS